MSAGEGKLHRLHAGLTTRERVLLIQRVSLVDEKEDPLSLRTVLIDDFEQVARKITTTNEAEPLFVSMSELQCPNFRGNPRLKTLGRSDRQRGTNDSPAKTLN